MNTIYITPSGTATPDIYRATALASFEAQPSMPTPIGLPTWTPPEGSSGAPLEVR